MADLLLVGQFIETSTKSGKDGLSPTVDVERILLASPFTRTAHLTGQSATAITRRGLYSYIVTGADPTLYAYIGTFISTSADVDQKEVAALAMVIPDAKPSTLATSTALATAQADLDTLTGTDGATLATLTREEVTQAIIDAAAYRSGVA